MVFKIFAASLVLFAVFGLGHLSGRQLNASFYAVGCSCGGWASVHSTREAAESSFLSRLGSSGHSGHTVYIVRGQVVRALTLANED